MPATNKSATISGITIERFAGGKIVETWNTYDQLGMMQQLGMVPKPG
jgi:predicted ester cyclase